MRIGVDFDNTIVSYDALFHKVAREKDVIPDDLPVNKIAIRDYLRAQDKEAIWTEMQGYVYGARMQEAQCYAEVLTVMGRLKAAGHTLAIISHKTKYPYLGQQYDLHAAARLWIKENLQTNALIAAQHIFFELTKIEKLARIIDFNCDVFIDDLPEILLTENFPEKTRRILFDPEKNHHDKVLPNTNIVSSWSMLENILL